MSLDRSESVLSEPLEFCSPSPPPAVAIWLPHIFPSELNIVRAINAVSIKQPGMSFLVCVLSDRFAIW